MIIFPRRNLHRWQLVNMYGGRNKCRWNAR